MLFIHIPKTAGTSLRGYFYNIFGPLNVGWWGIDLDPSKKITYDELFNNNLLVGGHNKKAAIKKAVFIMY